MNNKIVWYVAGAVVVIIIIAVFVLGGNKAGAPQSENLPGTMMGGKSMSMKELFASGLSQTCTFNTSSSQAISAGTIFQTSGHLRGDFSAVSGGKTIASHMLTDGQLMYIWTDGTAQGLKMSFAGVSASANQSQSVNPDQKVDYKCNPWPVDQGKFALPAGVTFSDMNALLNTGTNAGAGAGTNSSQCAVCDEAPTAAQKAQCKAALNCK